MGEAQVERTLTLAIFDEEEEANEAITSTPPPPPPPPPPLVSRYKWWLRVTIYTIFSLSGQSINILLLQLYFQRGGNSKWISTLAQTAGFPVLLPLFFFFFQTQKHAPHNNNNNNNNKDNSSLSNMAITYIFIGIFLAANCTCYSLALSILPASTFSLICSSQLAFTAFFSYFLNTQKFTPLIINSLVLLTMSSTLLVFQQDDQQGSSKNISKTKYAIGFMCAVGGAATAGLFLSTSQFAFRKIIKSTTFRVVLNMVIWVSFVATLLIVIGVFASGEWKKLKGEMEGYKLGRGSYVITLVGIAMSLQVNLIGVIGLVFEVSSLFSNVIGALGVPIVPIFAVVFFHDKMSGVKVIAMLLGIWGIASYIYQEYLDDDSSNSKTEIKDHINEVSLTERA